MASANLDLVRSIYGAWEEFRIEVEEYRELDEERVIVLPQVSGRGKSSGLELGMWTQAAALFHIREGKVTRFVFYWDRERALGELGLAPGARSPNS